MNEARIEQITIDGEFTQNYCCDASEGETDFFTCDGIYTVHIKIPNKTGVYFFFAEENLVYIGSSLNLQNRIKTSLLERLKQAEIDQISFCVTDTEIEARQLEKVLIKKYHPVLNETYNNFKVYGMKVRLQNMESFDVNDLERYDLHTKTQEDLFYDIAKIACEVYKNKVSEKRS